MTLDRREVESTADAYDPDNTVVRSENELAQKSYEVGKTTTRIVSRAPRLARLSAAVLVSAENGAPRAASELQRLGALARHAVGFDAGRGDRFEMSEHPVRRGGRGRWRPGAAPGRGPLLGRSGAAGARARGCPGPAAPRAASAVRVRAPQPPPEARAPARPDPLATRDRARHLVEADPARAAHLLRAWIALDAELKDHRA